MISIFMRIMQGCLFSSLSKGVLGFSASVTRQEKDIKGIDWKGGGELSLFIDI